MSISDEKYVSFTTFRKNGERKSAPVWIADADGTLGFTTGSESWKLRRLSNDDRCELQPSDQRGGRTAGSEVTTGTAREATADEFQAIKTAIDAKYGIWTKVIPIVYKLGKLFGKGGEAANTAIVVSLD